MITDKAKKEFLNYYWENYIGKTRFLNEKSDSEDFFNSLYRILQTALIVEWFDTVGITVDIMPVLIDGVVFFEPNTFCLKHEIVTEEFVKFENRQEATEKAISKANEIFNTYFND